MKDYLALTKPRVIWLILMSTGIGYCFGLRGVLGWLGPAARGSGNGVACIRHVHAEPVVRARSRRQRCGAPGCGRCRAGRIRPARAFWFGVALSVLGFVELWLGANLLAALLGAVHPVELPAGSTRR